MTLVLVIFFVIHESEISSGMRLISSDKSSKLVFITYVNVSILRSVDVNREFKIYDATVAKKRRSKLQVQVFQSISPLCQFV